MNEAFSIKLRKTHTFVWLFLGMLVYKFSMDLGYLYLTRISDYMLCFNSLKYVAGLAWCIVLFLAIRHNERKASSFFLCFIFFFQIVPITSVYSMGDENSTYYHLLCLSVFLCELLVSNVNEHPRSRRSHAISQIMTLCYAVATIILVVYVIRKNGVPHLSLLNIYTVYDYRSSGAFQCSKYMYYMLDWATKVFLPFGIAKFLVDKRYLMASFLLTMQLLLYLYTGMKLYLFAVPFVLVFTLWARRKNCYQEICLLGCAGLCILTLLSYFTEPGSLWYYIFGLFVNRVMLLSARLKFQYFDYFTNHPKLGLWGIFPQWVFPIHNNYYDAVSYTHEIGAIYFNSWETNANTGFFAEGYMRFGYVGIILLAFLLAVLLQQMDRFQERVGFPLTIGVFTFPIYLLTDGHLLDSLVLGPWMFLVAILLFYKTRQMPPEPPLLHLEHRRLVLKLPTLKFRL